MANHTTSAKRDERKRRAMLYRQWKEERDLQKARESITASMQQEEPQGMLPKGKLWEILSKT